jgi:hypothetical protein
MYNQFEEKYPLLFRNKDEMEPINLFGIECRQGWKSLLNNAFALLYNKYKYSLDTYLYWKEKEPKDSATQEKLEESKQRLQEVEAQLPVVAQIKEKFGTLRFYCDNVNDYARGVIDMTEALSAEICEVCGGRGKHVGGRWVQTLCENCNTSSTTNQPK